MKAEQHNAACAGAHRLRRYGVDRGNHRLYTKKIDAITYERQRDSTRKQIAQATIELEDARLDQIDVEGLLGYAEYVLTNAARMWIEATAEQRPRLQRALFPEGLRLEDGRFGTAVTWMAFTQLQAIDARELRMASPAGTADGWQVAVKGYSDLKHVA